MPYRHPRTTPVATAVQIRRAEEGSPGGFTVGGGAGTIEWVGPAGGGESETPHSGVLRAGVGGGRGVETLLLVLGTKYTKYPSWGAFVMVPAARFFRSKPTEAR